MPSVALRPQPAEGGEEERPGGVGEAVEELVRRAAAAEHRHDDVVLDVIVDGYRCLILRVDPPTGTQLSPREREIARMVAEGHPNKTIAAVLEISTWTVGTYLRRIFAKLNVTSRAAMVAKLMEQKGRRAGL